MYCSSCTRSSEYRSRRVHVVLRGWCGGRFHVCRELAFPSLVMLVSRLVVREVHCHHWRPVFRKFPAVLRYTQAHERRCFYYTTRPNDIKKLFGQRIRRVDFSWSKFSHLRCSGGTRPFAYRKCFQLSISLCMRGRSTTSPSADSVFYPVLNVCPCSIYKLFIISQYRVHMPLMLFYSWIPNMD